MLISGSISVPGSNLVSGSAQIDVLSTTNIARLATTGSNIFTGEITGTNAKFSGGICASSFNPTGSTISCNGMYLPAGNTLGFSTNGTNRLTLSSTGNVSIGNTNDTYKLDVSNGSSNVYIRAITSGSANWATLLLENGDGSWHVTNNDTGTFNIGTSNDPSGQQKLSIASTGAATFSSSVTTNGDISIAKSVPILYFNATSFSNGVLYNPGTSLRFTNSAGTTPPFIYDILTGAVTIGNLASGAVTSTNGTLSASSDMNLKISDGYIDNALDKIMNLKPRYFYWKEESGLPTDIRQLGFYAQEVNQALGEEAANTPKNENDKWGIYDRGIIAMLTKAIQEQQSQIDILKQEIINLKNK
jgi:hypothetical protein